MSSDLYYLFNELSPNDPNYHTRAFAERRALLILEIIVHPIYSLLKHLTPSDFYPGEENFIFFFKEMLKVSPQCIHTHINEKSNRLLPQKVE